MIQIFKIDSKGKLRTIQYTTEGDKLIQRSGIVGGNLKEDVRVCTPKNVGKANETTGAEQAVSEMHSKIAEKVKKEYFYSEAEARDNANAIYPMLAKEFHKEERKIDWSSPVYIQPKLDGTRCLAFVTGNEVKLMSRTNTPITTVKHIQEALTGMPDGVYDGELYVHGLSFQENRKLVTKYRPGQTEDVKFHMYDMAIDERFTDRYLTLIRNYAFAEQAGTSPLTVVTTDEIGPGMGAIKNIHKQNLHEGYEGSIIRWGDEPYKSKGRSSHLLKYKDFQDTNAVIRDVIAGPNAPDQGILVLGQNGQSYKSSIKGTHEYRRSVLANKENYIGKTANIRFFELTDDGIPRFPVCVEIK